MPITSSAVSAVARTTRAAQAAAGSSFAVDPVLVSLLLLVALACWVWYCAALAAVFRRLGAPAWKAWTPVVQEAELFERGGLPGWSVLYLVVPVVQVWGLVLRGVAAHRVGRSLGRGAGATVLAVLLPPVWASVVGWGPARVQGGPVGVGHPDDLDDDIDPLDTSAGQTGPVPGTPWPDGWAGDRAPAPPAPTPPHDAQPTPTPSVTPVPTLPPTLPVTPLPTPVPDPVLAPPAGAPAPGLLPPAPAHERPHEAPASPPPAPERPPVAPASPVLPAHQPPAPAREPLITGAPRSTAAPADPAERRRGEDLGELERTVLRPRAPRWRLRLDDGRAVALEGPRVVLGRQPLASEDAQVLAVPDSTRTISKTHARLDLHEGVWWVTDLGSTNGVVVTDDDGAEHRLERGATAQVTGRIRLGDLGMVVERARVAAP